MHAGPFQFFRPALAGELTFALLRMNDRRGPGRGASCVSARARQLLPDPKKLGVGERLDTNPASQRLVDDPEQAALELGDLVFHRRSLSPGSVGFQTSE